MNPDSARRASIVVSLLAAAVSGWIAWHSQRGLETLWDEQVDHDIAVRLVEHPLTGGDESLDASQMRLPMYVNALAFAVTGRDDLRVSRMLSIVAGMLTIIATAALGRACFGPLVGALASILLGLSPYFLSFERISMTEGDVFVALFATLALWAFVRYMQRPNPERWLLAGLLIALAIGSKLFAGYLFIVCAVLTVSSGPSRSSESAGRVEDLRRLHRLLGMNCAVLLGTAVAAYFSRSAACVGWAIALVIWLQTTVFVVRQRVMASGRVSRYVAMVAYSTAAVCVLMPAHVVDHQIAREVLRRLLRWDNSFPLALWSDHLRLYAGIILVKLTIPLGVMTAVGLVLAGFRERDDGRWRACTLSFVFYVVMICFLPLRQTFYLMGVYPCMMIVTAGLAVEVGGWLSRVSRGAARVWCVVVAAMLIHLGVRVYQGHPWYQLYGYDNVGNRWLGAESRGYRNLIQTPSDGVESLIKWCSEDGRVKKGDLVVSYLWEAEIIGKALPKEPFFAFVPRGVTPASDAVPPAPSIDGADFVLLHINNLLGYGDLPPDWPDSEALSGRFEVIHTVKRGDFAVGWVYARRE